MEESMSKASMVNRLLSVKRKSGKTFGQIGNETGLTNVYVAQLLRRQAQLKPETAPKLRAALPDLPEEFVEEMMRPPLRSYEPNILQDPTIYRLNEAVMHFGESIKEIINEEFGDGIMSAIDFYCSVDKVKGIDGKDRVVMTFDGKYLPHTEQKEITSQSDEISDLSTSFKIEEATISGIQLAFKQNQLTSKQLVQYYLDAIEKLNPTLDAVIEVNPDALTLAEKADKDRQLPGDCPSAGLRGIPVLLKDNIATKDRLNTTSGSLALLGSVVPRDAGVIDRLRQAGAIILGKVGLSEWANFRGENIPSGWSARGGAKGAKDGTVKNPYVLTGQPGGSSTGSAVSVAANLVTVSLGTETNMSIIDPCNFNCVVGIKPTVGLTSRSGVIPISLRQDTVGPIGRTVSDAVCLLDVIVGYDPRDEMTKKAAQYIPYGGYKKFLKEDGLNGKRIGNMWHIFKRWINENSPALDSFPKHFNTMRQIGAVLIDDLEIPKFWTMMDPVESGEVLALKYEFKRDLNNYLSNLVQSPIRSLADAIAFNEDKSEEEKLEEYGQSLFIESEKTILPSGEYTKVISDLRKLNEDGFEKFMTDNKLDAMMAPGSLGALILGNGGYPGITVPAAFEKDGMPIGVLFAGLRGSDATLIEIAYAFEYATNVRRPPTIVS